MNDQELYDQVGEEGFTRLIRAFYEQVPDDDILGAMYPADDLAGSETRLRDFLLFRFGGVSTYLETRGHPALRMRHMKFPLDQAARDRWMLLMSNALVKASMPDTAASVFDMLIVSCGSTIATVGNINGLPMPIERFASMSHSAAPDVTSLLLPEVVGTAMKGSPGR